MVIRMSDNTCSICLEEVSHHHELKCKHKFHSRCIVNWLIRTNTCPTCRRIITSITLGLSGQFHADFDGE